MHMLWYILIHQSHPENRKRKAEGLVRCHARHAILMCLIFRNCSCFSCEKKTPNISKAIILLWYTYKKTIWLHWFTTIYLRSFWFNHIFVYFFFICFPRSLRVFSFRTRKRDTRLRFCLSLFRRSACRLVSWVRKEKKKKQQQISCGV